MSLYSVLMVDDEDEVIRIIRRKIPWEEMGFTICGQAANGIEALEMAEELQPDVVMTDIKMPYMDGLAMAKQLREKYPALRIIVCSGFDEFDYVKQAISIEVEEYLLKPIDADEIKKVFGKIKCSLDEDRDLKNNMAHLREYYEKSLPYLREGILGALIEGAVSTDSVRDSLEDYDIDLSGPNYAVSVLHFSTNSIPEGVSRQLIRYSVAHLLEESALNRNNTFLLNFRNQITILSQFETAEEISGYTDACDRFCKEVKKALNISVTVGIGTLVSRLGDLPVSYQSAKEAVSYRTIYGAGGAINISEVDPKQYGRVEYESFGSDMQAIFKQLKLGTKEELTQRIEDLVDNLHHANLSLWDLNIVLMEISTGFYRFINSSDLVPEKIWTGDEDFFSVLKSKDSPEDLKEELIAVGVRLYDALQEQRMNKTGSFVRQAKEYVRENYSNPNLCIELICSELGVSSAYFSTIFKRETGKTFINYLTEYRMLEAERLLIEQDEKKYIIAEKVGYSDPSYFSYVFKKWFGVSPMKYKTGKITQNEK